MPCCSPDHQFKSFVPATCANAEPFLVIEQPGDVHADADAGLAPGDVVRAVQRAAQGASR